MSWILVGGAMFCGWAMLRTMGGERERRVQEQRHATAPPPPPKPAPAPQPKRTFGSAKNASKPARRQAA